MTEPTAYSTKISIPLPDRERLERVLGDGFDPNKTLEVVQMMAGTEDMYPAVVGLVRAVFGARGVDPKLRQMIILRAAKVLNAPYEWHANVMLSLNNGLTYAHVYDAASDGPVCGIEPEYMLVCQATGELLKTGTLADETLRSLMERHGEEITRKIVLIIAWFSLLSLFLNGCRVPMETIDEIGGKRTPLD